MHIFAQLFAFSLIFLMVGLAFWRPAKGPVKVPAIRSRSGLQRAQERLVALEEYRGIPHIDTEIAAIQKAIEEYVILDVLDE